MRHFIRGGFKCCVAVALANLGMVISSHAGVVTGSPVSVFTTTDNSRDIVLSSGSPVFTADLSTYSSFSGQTHSILGALGTQYPGFADVEHQDASSPDGIHGDIALPYAMVGRKANGDYGHFVWKFKLPAGYETGPGAQINAGVYFRHDPSSSAGVNALFGILDSLPVYSDLSGPSNYPPTIKKTAQEIFPVNPSPNEFATYNGSATLAIPAGLTEFYVDFSDQGSSARWALTALSVNGAPVAVPEPASFGMLALAGLMLKRSRR